MTPTGSRGPAARFAAAVQVEPVPLAEAACCVAAHVGGSPHLDVDAGTRRVEALAAEVPGDDLEAVVEHLFVTRGLRGDAASYYDPANSMLPAVLDRGVGIPITLALLAVDVARRRGAAATVVGMPGHVLIGDGPGLPTRWVDGFHGGVWLDEAGARARFAAIHGPQAPFDPTFLRAIPDGAVLARLLANLVGIYATLGDGHRLVRVHELRAVIPGLGARERPQWAAALTAVGRYEEAADLWEVEAAERSGADALAADAQVRVLRANFN